MIRGRAMLPTEPIPRMPLRVQRYLDRLLLEVLASSHGGAWRKESSWAEALIYRYGLVYSSGQAVGQLLLFPRPHALHAASPRVQTIWRLSESKGRR